MLRYSNELKNEAIKRVINGETVVKVSRSLKIGESTLYTWIACVKGQPERCLWDKEYLCQENKRNSKLRRQIHTLSEENKILKKAMVIIVKDLK